MSKFESEDCQQYNVSVAVSALSAECQEQHHSNVSVAAKPKCDESSVHYICGCVHDLSNTSVIKHRESSVTAAAVRALSNLSVISDIKEMYLLLLMG